jgi:hypothetical protein
MRLLVALILALLLCAMAMPAIGQTAPDSATSNPVSVTTDLDSVRIVCAMPEPRDFSAFDQEALPGILILIIENDPLDADSHDAVMAGAMAALAATRVPEAVPELIKMSDKYPTVCLPLLGQFADGHAVYAILAFAVGKDPKLQIEAANALCKLPEPSKDNGKDYVVSLETALATLAGTVSDIEDEEVSDALWKATTHLMEISLQFGMVSDDMSRDDWAQEDKTQEKYK